MVFLLSFLFFVVFVVVVVVENVTTCTPIHFPQNNCPLSLFRKTLAAEYCHKHAVISSYFLSATLFESSLFVLS